MKKYICTIKCKICDTEWESESEYGMGICPTCGQKYEYDETQFIVLTEAQWKLLRENYDPTTN